MTAQMWLTRTEIVLFFSSYLCHKDISLKWGHLEFGLEVSANHILILKLSNNKTCLPNQHLSQRPSARTLIYITEPAIKEVIILLRFKSMSSQAKKAPPFLLKTYDMLENQSYFATIHWNQTEDGFVITDPQAFSAHVLPLHFKHSNMHSYIRQLNMYGFSKKRGATSSYYSHPCFIRKHPQLICQIQRRVQHKAPKVNRPSVASIDDHFPEQAYLPLLKVNQVLLIEQIANLQMLLAEIQNDQVRDKLQSAAGKYIAAQSSLLSKLRGKESAETEATLETGKSCINDLHQ